MEANPSLKPFKLTFARYLAVTILLLAPGQFASANLITNGNFQTGDFTGWTVTNPGGLSILVSSGPVPDPTDGTFFLGASGFGAISQSFTTTPGAFYTLSFFYQPTSAGTPMNEFRVLWNGSVIYDNLNSISGGTFTFKEQATGISTTLRFEGRNSPAYDFLDNISVTAAAVPDTGDTLFYLTIGLVALTAFHLRAVKHGTITRVE